jgi:hypothetical protein
VLKEFLEEYHDRHNRFNSMVIPDRTERVWRSDFKLHVAGEQSVLFIRVPYLGFRATRDTQLDSLKLSEYGRLMVGNGIVNNAVDRTVNEDDLWVHQAWFAIIRSGK